MGSSLRDTAGHHLYTTKKLVTCNRCGKQHLGWRQSAQGNWYLANTSYPDTVNARGEYSIGEMAHVCMIRTNESIDAEIISHNHMLAMLREELAENEAAFAVSPTRALASEIKDTKAEIAEREAKIVALNAKKS